MLLGYAMPENTGVYDDILPMDAVQGMSAVLAGYLASFIDSSEQLLNELDNTRTIEQWIQFTHQLLDRFFLTHLGRGMKQRSHWSGIPCLTSMNSCRKQATTNHYHAVSLSVI